MRVVKNVRVSPFGTLVKSHNPEHDHGRGKPLSTSASTELDNLVAKYIHEHPGVTRDLAVHEIFRATPGLYDRVRAETTHNRHGQTLSEIYDNVEVAKSDGTLDAQIAEAIEGLMAKSTSGATREQFLKVLFKRNPEMYERWRRESCA